jgi:hypothetical protein
VQETTGRNGRRAAHVVVHRLARCWRPIGSEAIAAHLNKIMLRSDRHFVTANTAA